VSSADPASVRVRLRVEPDAAAVARAGAAAIAATSRAAAGGGDVAAIAVSGGSTPWAMVAALGDEDVAWDAVTIWQVDERVAPRGHDDRALTHLEASLPAPGLARLRPMPVDDLDEADDRALEAAASSYAAELPPRFALVHLGIGEDGHTASLVPGDTAADARDRDVAVTSPYRGRRRLTLTLPVFDRAGSILWIATGATKTEPLRRLLARDASIPAARVANAHQLAIVDDAAWPAPRPV
jgi:6-phosphogluconolactonase/glucosamine-6-phosphate isomerase/deaminase